MKPTGEVFTSYPPQYPHACINCNYWAVKDQPYPFIEWKETPNVD